MNEDLGNVYERCKLARNENTAPETLARLAEDEHWIVRQNAASNTNTPADILCKLARDADWLVSIKVTDNANTPVEALRELVKDKEYLVRKAAQTALSCRPNTDPKFDYER